LVPPGRGRQYPALDRTRTGRCETAAVAAISVYRLDIRLLEHGWNRFTDSSLIDVLDEFTVEPTSIDSTVEWIVRISGIALIALGLSRSQTSLRSDPENAADNAIVISGHGRRDRDGQRPHPVGPGVVDRPLHPVHRRGQPR
jgi:hypothetical protein